MIAKNKFRMFNRGEIKPKGWLKTQLRIQADGLAGNLDKVWPDVRDSKWIGGDREGWERVPYWLDGFIPLAYLLDDADLKKRADKYVTAIISRQESDGWICPCTLEERRSYDLWPGILIAKVLSMYADLSGSVEAEESLYRLLKNLWEFTRHCTLHNWAAMRWFEALIPIYWMYERKPEEWLIRLALRFQQMGYDYNGLFGPFRDQKPERVWTYSTHVVNLSMAIKQDALMSRISGSDPNDFAERMLKELFEHHGMAVGHFTGDECLMGDSPVQGSEFCGIVEAMYSYEWLLAITGNPKWGDYLERLAFNALPATASQDMWSHQYDQLTNQVRCERLPEGHVIFGTNGPESHLFGLEPNYGCCTANFGQSWPKFAMSTFMKSESGIVSSVIAPSRIKTKVNGKPVQCDLKTDYPFGSKLEYTIHADSPVEFELLIRIPSCAKSAKVNGQAVEPGKFHNEKRSWSGTEKVVVELEFAAEIVSRPRQMGVLWHGPLLYSVPIAEEWIKHEYTKNDVERKYPYCDYEILPKSKWNYGFSANDFKFVQGKTGETPFANDPAPVEIMAQLVEIPWEEEHGVCTAKPSSRVPISDPHPVKMIPYGCAKLRMTEMPILF